MSLLRLATRNLLSRLVTPSPQPRTEGSRLPPASQPQVKAPRHADRFTPAPTQRPGEAKKPELNPAPLREGYSKPVSADQLPPPDQGTGILTLNTASGAGDEYRTGDKREEQALLIQQTDASIVAFQEVDVNVNSTGNVNTALDVIARVNPDFGVFASGDVPRFDINDTSAPATAVRTGADGTTLYQTPSGTVITGESFSGDDRPIQGKEVSDAERDSGADATYGNAIYVAAPEQVTEAYTLALPNSPEEGAIGAADAGQLAALADGQLTPEERAALGTRNEALRDADGPEPRSALVTRVRGEDGQERTIINVHLASADDPKLREAQLEYLAQVVAAESKGPPAREVVVMGDFNSSTAEVGAAFGKVGLERVVGGAKANGDNFDQVWTTAGVNTQNSAQVETDGVTDHKYAGYTEIS